VFGHPLHTETIQMDSHGSEDRRKNLDPVPVDPVRARASEMLWAVLNGTALEPGAAFFPALVRHLASALGVRYVFVAECTDDARTRVRTLAFWNGDAVADNLELDLVGTPCEAVIKGRESCHTHDLQTRFPADRGLVNLGAESYLGVPVVGTTGEILGHLAVLDVAPMEDDEARALLLRTFASRAAMELERLRASHQIAALNNKLMHAAERARSLLAINNAVVLNLTRDALFRAITDALRPVMPFDRSTIFLYDEDRNVLRLVAAESAIPSEYFVPGLELPLAGSHAGSAFRSQRVFFRPDLARERQYHGEDVLVREGFRSLVVVPLVVRGKSIGTLNLGSLRPMQYGAPEAELLQEVANQLALAIENMREYEEIGRLKAQLERENVYLREEIRGEHNFEEIVGNSPELTAALRTVDRVAPTDTTVLILGETGTGKELVARAIHSRSRRHKHPLVKVNCGAISAGLIESELFGHVKGAFTGALDRRIGRFELANGGTLFLDEVGELPLDMQVKLLRVLQEQEFEPVGSSRTTKVDVRIIAATNRHLEQEVAAGRFRADLYYRLNVLPLRVPSLRERRADIPQLTTFFVQRNAKRIGRSVAGVSRESMERLMEYQWPGNIRELENVIERALVLSSGGILEIGRDFLPTLAPTVARPIEAAVSSPVAAPERAAPSVSPPSSSLEEVERAHISATLSQTDWVIEGPRGAARILDMHPNTLRSRIKKLGLTRRESSGRL
jgi:formate hydrogenlyase transcriptional activator